MVLYRYVQKLSLIKKFSLDLLFFVAPEEDIVKFRAVGPVRTKASLAITFNLFGTSFMIINSHFEGLIYLNDEMFLAFSSFSWSWI